MTQPHEEDVTHFPEDDDPESKVGNPVVYDLDDDEDDRFDET